MSVDHKRNMGKDCTAKAVSQTHGDSYNLRYRTGQISFLKGKDDE